MIQILPVIEMPFQGFDRLKQESQQEGFRFPQRLEDEWMSGINQFSKPGEGLYKAVVGNEVIAIGGINVDPYANGKATGRLRRFYVTKKWRGRGVGRKLLAYILAQEPLFFTTITLRTDNPAACVFYEKCGFERVLDDPFVTHQKSFKA